MTGYPKNLAELNRFLADHGLPKVRQADGFLYFVDAAGNDMGDVDVESPRSLPFSEWYDEARKARASGSLGCSYKGRGGTFGSLYRR